MAATMTAIALISGCGGDGSSSPTMQQPTTITEEAALRAVAPIAQRLARNDPAPGSVTQSARGDSNNVTLDRIDSTARFQGGVVHVRATDADGRRFDTAESGTITIQRSCDPATGICLVEAARREGDGWRWAGIYTNIESAADTDFLTGGLWVYVPDDANDLTDLSIAAFADGSDPFTGNIAALIGTATYNGSATAVYVDTSGRTDLPIGQLFGDGNQLGTIAGEISNIEEDDSPVTGLRLTLETAPITADNAGFFKGTASTNFDGQSFAGKWGGQFYGNGANPTDRPGSVAGTFGLSNGNGSTSVVGVYGAER